MDDITELFCTLDDFYQKFKTTLEQILISPSKSRIRKSKMSLSEAMTTVILFHKSGFRFFKYFHCQMIIPFWKSAFTHLVSYNLFTEIMPKCMHLSSCFFQQVKGSDTGISSIDSMKLVVFHNRIVHYKSKLIGKLVNDVFVLSTSMEKLKVFKILSKRYRNRRKRIGQCLNLIAAIYNMELLKK